MFDGNDRLLLLSIDLFIMHKISEPLVHADSDAGVNVMPRYSGTNARPQHQRTLPSDYVVGHSEHA